MKTAFAEMIDQILADLKQEDSASVLMQIKEDSPKTFSQNCLRLLRRVRKGALLK